MRKIFYLFVLILMTGILAAGNGADASLFDIPRPILYTYYRQMGWGDRIQIGFIDEEGGVWTLSGHDSELKWPYKAEEQLAYLSSKRMKFTQETKLKYDDVFSVKSLIFSVEDQGSKSVPAANDAGTEKSWAVRYQKNQDPEIILLGMSGDDAFENFDPDAQALYLILRRTFPKVTSYAGLMGPAGFTPVPISDFIGADPAAVLNADITGILTDCESGPVHLELTDKDKAALRALIQTGKVIGKADNIVSTGGVYAYTFCGPDGKRIFSIELYKGNLVTSDGNYYISAN